MDSFKNLNVLNFASILIFKEFKRTVDTEVLDSVTHSAHLLCRKMTN